MGSALKVKQLTVHYDHLPVLWEISFDLPLGKLAAIVGPNGAGKSTLLKSILGFQKPTVGSVQVFGKSYSKVCSRVAYVPQRSEVDWTFPICVLDVVAMGRYHKLGLCKWVGKKDRALAFEALEKVGMTQFARRQISALSGGQQQRVFLARALLQEADLYLMDEPFSGIDQTTEKELLSLFSSLAADGKTLLVVHHDLVQVRKTFDWAILLNSCLIAAGPIDKVYSEENLQKAYGSASSLLTEAKKRSLEKHSGD